jgi:hypothetical protein
MLKWVRGDAGFDARKRVGVSAGKLYVLTSVENNLCEYVCVCWHTHAHYNNAVRAGTNSHVCGVVINAAVRWVGRVNEWIVSLF